MYQKHQMDFLFDSMSPNFEKVQTQYQFAKDNLDSIKKVAPEDASSGKKGAESYAAVFLTQFFQLLKRMLYLAAAFVVFVLLFNKVRGCFL